MSYGGERCIRSTLSLPSAPVTVATSADAPVDFDALVDLGISKPARYLGNELGVKPRDWEADWKDVGVRWALTSQPRDWKSVLAMASRSQR